MAKDYSDTAALLTRRQANLYTDRCSIYDSGKAQRQVNGVTGEPVEGAPPRLIGFNVPCKYTLTSNIDDVTPVGRIKRDILDTTDRIHFHTSAPIENGCWVVMTTPGHPAYGAVHRAEGAPQHIWGDGLRRLRETQIVLLTQVEKAPEGLVP